MLKIIRNIFRTTNAGPRHLGRWARILHTTLVDYANVDSRGDRLCGCLTVHNHNNREKIWFLNIIRTPANK